VVDRIFSGHWPNLIYVIAVSFLLSYALTWIAGSASRGVALRKVVVGDVGDTVPDPPATTANAQKWYIESTSPEQGLPHSCSFVEFDERGDYLDFYQHKHAYEKVLALAQKHEHLIVVIFLHGWQNNGQSGNVVDFNEFLHQLATHTDVKGPHHRVHGIYLSWRGACLKHAINPSDETFRQVAKRYGGDIVDLRQAARFPTLNECLEIFSYFDRKGVPEHLSSGTSLSRTIMTCAHVAKRFRPRCHVFLIGHSFGGLMLERTFQNASIGELIMAWPFGEQESSEDIKANPLPFDTVLLVNSAAPSIYAKQFQSFLAAHGHALFRYKVVGANSPVFFSLTSSGDWATGKTHRLANTFCFLLPTLRRKYRGDDFILASEGRSKDVLIQQSYYYRHTPGHNPLLVNRFIEPSRTPTSDAQVAPPINSAPIFSTPERRLPLALLRAKKANLLGNGASISHRKRRHLTSSPDTKRADRPTDRLFGKQSPASMHIKTPHIGSSVARRRSSKTIMTSGLNRRLIHMLRSTLFLSPYESRSRTAKISV
jgi:hypothetical protein